MKPNLSFNPEETRRRLDEKMISELAALNKKYSINPAGEGGELESFVCDAPFFRKKIIVKTSRKDCKGNSGVFVIEEAFLSEK